MAGALSIGGPAAGSEGGSGVSYTSFSCSATDDRCSGAGCGGCFALSFQGINRFELASNILLHSNTSSNCYVNRSVVVANFY